MTSFLTNLKYFCQVNMYVATLLRLLSTFRFSSAYDVTHTMVTFSPKYQRNSVPTATPAVPSSATPGSNGWKPTIGSVRKTWGNSCTWILRLNALLLIRSVCVNTTVLIVVSSSGTDRIDFKFYDLLEQILDKQPSTSSTVVTDPIEISEDSEGELTTETGK